MTKLYQYFKNDFRSISLDRELTFGIQHGDGNKEQIKINERVLFQHDSSTRFFTFYIPISNLTALFCKEVLVKFDEYKKNSSGVEAIGGYKGDLTIGKHETLYSNRIYFYTETEIGHADLKVLTEIAIKEKIYVTFRNQHYVKRKMDLEMPLAFISHDSRDKKIIAKPLAIGLSLRSCPVWYDEYSLKVGDSLRESIEKGIKEVKKCIIIITTNFLNNPGWSKKEFNSIFTREMIFNERIVLPIWFNVDKKDVYNYSPSLADTVALIWPDSKNKTEQEYKKEQEILISKIHTAINLKTTANNG